MDIKGRLLDSLASGATGPAQETGTDMRLLFEAAPLAVFVHDGNGGVVDVNQRACTHLGYDRETLLTLSVGDIDPDFDRERTARMAELLAVGDHMVFETRHRCADGTKVPVEVHVCSFTNGREQLLLSYVHDVTARKQAEDALRQEHDFVRPILDTAGALIIVLDETGRVLSFNRACERATGFRAAEVVGRPIWDSLLPPEQVDAVRRVFESGSGTQPIHDYENDWLTRSGERRTIAWRNSWLPVVGSRIYGIGIGIDVTDQQQAERRLQEERARYAQLVRSLPNIIVALFDRRLRIILCDGDRASCGSQAGPCRHGQPLAEAFPAEIADALLPLCRGALLGLSDSIELASDGLVMRHRVVPLRDEAGDIDAGMLVSENVTEARLSRQALKEAKTAAENASRAKSEFLAAVSHELRTPLNAILGFSEIIRDRAFGASASDRYADYAADIHASGLHLLTVVNDILDLSRVESGKVRLSPEPCRIDRLFEETIRLLEDRASRGGLLVCSEICGDLVEVRADRRSLRQVLFNLVSNAVKFTPAGGRVRLRARALSGAVELAVSDTGIGIAAKDLARIRAPFEQIRNRVDTSHEGTGLGLPLVDELVRLHGGEVIIESTLKVGTTVRVILPEPGNEETHPVR